MVPVWLKALLFVGGGVTAAAGAAYVTGALDPWLGKNPPVLASLPQQQEAQPAEEQVPAASEPEISGEAPLPDDPETTEKQSRLTAPVFDLLRVEPDGSVVVAGKAPARAHVEVLSGETVLAGADAGAEGDFVAVFDETLAPGDYVLSLRATDEDGQVSLSTQTAIVSVPERSDGQVLAMVEAPGAPASLLTVPEVSETPAQEVEMPSETPAAEAASAEVEAEVEEEAAAGQAQEDVSAPQEKPATQETDTAAPQDEPAEEQVAAAAPEADERPAGDQTPAATGHVVVEAVEIEGDTIFVAGHADPGLTVRVYANELLLGDAVASEGGRFLVEARRELPVGNYLIRADLLSKDGTVVARAAVPFEREAGENIAAVAAQPQPEAQESASAADAQTQLEEAPAEETAAAPEAQTEPAEPAVALEAETEVAVAPAGEAEATAPALQRADGSVIIRRGDTLWHISRRVYGHGMRYSTIYLANQDQIRNPDLIWPGQVFTVPQATAEGEAANLDAVADQVVPSQDAPAAQ